MHATFVVIQNHYCCGKVDSGNFQKDMVEHVQEKAEIRTPHFLTLSVGINRAGLERLREWVFVTDAEYLKNCMASGSLSLSGNLDRGAGIVLISSWSLSVQSWMSSVVVFQCSQHSPTQTFVEAISQSIWAFIYDKCTRGFMTTLKR